MKRLGRHRRHRWTRHRRCFERIGHFFGRIETLSGFAFEGPAKPRIERRRDLGAMGTWRRKNAQMHRDGERSDRFTTKRNSSRQREIRHDRKRPKIRFERDITRTEQLLGTHVERRAHHRSRRRRAVHRCALIDLRHAEIEQLDEEFSIDVAEENVVRLDVAMNDSQAVRTRQSSRGLRHDLDDIGNRKRSVPTNRMLEILAFEVLHHDVRNFVRRNAVIENLRNVRMFDLRGGFRFRLKTLHQRLIIEVRDGHELDRDLRTERQVIGKPNASHSPFTKEAGESQRWRDLLTSLHSNVLLDANSKARSEKAS